MIDITIFLEVLNGILIMTTIFSAIATAVCLVLKCKDQRLKCKIEESA